MSKIDETNAVTQESLETTTEPTQDVQVRMHDFAGTQTQPNNETANETTETDPIIEDGVAELIEDAPAVQEQEEVQSEEPAVEEEVINLEENDSEPTEKVAESGLPEWVEKLVKFNQETGGGLDEYQKLNKDYESLTDTQLLKEYYAQTKPGYTPEDIDLLLDSRFGTETVEEGSEMSRDDKLKLLALKDEVIKAKHYLNEGKQKYYADLKSGVQGAPEQYKEAVSFYDDYKKTSEKQAEIRKTFLNQSKEVFNESFKGFPFDSGGKKYRINVGDSQAVMNSQLDLNEVVGKFLNEDGTIADAAGWHKALWSAQNSDKLFNAGVEAGKALLAKERAQATKNPTYVNEGQSKPPQSGQRVKFLGTENNF